MTATEILERALGPHWRRSLVGAVLFGVALLIAIKVQSWYSDRQFGPQRASGSDDPNRPGQSRQPDAESGAGATA